MRFKKTLLDSGLRLITVSMPDNPSVTVLVMVEAGSKYESEKESGISHFLEHMVFKGTPKRPKAIDISRELDSIGANYNAFTTQEFTGYYAKAASKKLGKIMDIISDMYLNPLFDAGEIEKEKGVIVEEIRMYQDLPQQHVHDLFSELLYGDQPAGRNIAGTEANVRSFGRDDFIQYRGKHYLPGATAVIVAGSFDEKKLLRLVTDLSAIRSMASSRISSPSKNPNPSQRSKSNIKKLIRHTSLSASDFPVEDKRMPIMHVLSTILGRGMSSRLFSKMRDELGICYYIRTDHNAFTDHGFLSIAAGIDNSRVPEGIKNILEECGRLVSELVGNEELKKAKDHIAGTTVLNLESSDARAEYCGLQEIVRRKIKLPDEMIRKINKVTPAQVRELAGQIFANKGLNMAVVGRFKDGNEFHDYFTFD